MLSPEGLPISKSVVNSINKLGKKYFKKRIEEYF